MMSSVVGSPSASVKPIVCLIVPCRLQTS
eukprot:SAG22_NODE_2030_length_3113_cov_25.976443_1_plen_28_part_10